MAFNFGKLRKVILSGVMAASVTMAPASAGVFETIGALTREVIKGAGGLAMVAGGTSTLAKGGTMAFASISNKNAAEMLDVYLKVEGAVQEATGEEELGTAVADHTVYSGVNDFKYLAIDTATFLGGTMVYKVGDGMEGQKKVNNINVNNYSYGRLY